MSKNHPASETELNAGLKIIGPPPYGQWTPQENIAEAAERFEKALRLNPQHGPTHLYLGIAKLLAGDQTHRMHLHQALELMPKSPMAHVYFGWSHYNDPTTAQYHFSEANRLAPEYWLPHFERGRYLFNDSEYQQAINEFGKSIPDAGYMAHFLRAQAEQHLGRHHKAVCDLNRVIELKPDHHEAYILRAQSHNALDLFDESIADYDRALAAKPHDVELLVNRAMVKNMAGDCHGAIDDLTSAIHHAETTDPDHFHQRSVLLAEVKLHEAALNDINVAIVESPNRADFYLHRAAIRSAQAEDGADLSEHINFDLRMAEIIGN